MLAGFLFFLLFIPSTLAQQPYRILALHGVWENRTWDRAFDRALDEAIESRFGAGIELTSLNIGIDNYAPGQVPAPISEMVKFQIIDKQVDMVIAVLPRAIDFYLTLGMDEGIETLFVLPSETQQQAVEARPNTWSIQSTSLAGIRSNIELILELIPDLSSIEIVSGNSATDLVYLERARVIADEYSARTQFNFHSGMLLDELEFFSAQLPASAAIITLPYSEYGAGVRAIETEIMPRITANSNVPVFAVSDLFLGLGTVGGSMSSTANYAAAAAETIDNIMARRTDYERAEPATNPIRLDWQVLQRYNLDANRISFPFTIVNRPVRLWEEYPYQTLATVNVFLLLVIAVIAQQFLLHRTRATNKRIEESDRRSMQIAQRYSLVTRNSLDVIWTWDDQTRALSYCSPSIHTLLGYTPEEFMQLHLREILTASSSEDALVRIFAGSDEPQVFEAEMIRKDGSLVSVEIAAKRITTEQGGTPEWVGVTRDISQRKEEEQRRRALEQEVRQAQKFESLGTLAGGIAHDFNNILGILMGITDLLKIELAENKRAIELIDKLSKGTSRARGLVNQILTFSRQSSGEKVITELGPIIDETMDLIVTGVPRNITIHKAYRREAVKILADPNQVEQVLVNLLTNAYEAIGEAAGEVTISLDVELQSQERDLQHGRLIPGDYAVIRVRDNGPGLSAAELERIFDPFYTSKQLGNGMGLAIVHGIMLEHKGAIEVKRLDESDEEDSMGGLEFSLYFPLVDGDEAVASSGRISSPGIRKSKILVLDDQAELLTTITMMLEAMGHSCVACSDPHQAMDILARCHHDLDLVITDYSMPDISGLEVIRHCREHYPDLNLVLTTGYSAELENEAEAAREYLPQILQKPFTLDTLSQVLENSLH